MIAERSWSRSQRLASVKPLWVRGQAGAAGHRVQLEGDQRVQGGRVGTAPGVGQAVRWDRLGDAAQDAAAPLGERGRQGELVPDARLEVVGHEPLAERGWVGEGVPHRMNGGVGR
jgi:hypothetical protein